MAHGNSRVPSPLSSEDQMPTLILADHVAGAPIAFKCSDCDEVFSPPPVPRGARPWTPEEARAKLAAQFQEHVDKAHHKVKS